MYRVALVDDHHLVRAGFAALVSAIDGFRVEATSDNPDHLAAWLASPGLDVLLLDISLRGHSGLDVLQALHRDHPELPVLMLSMHVGRDYVLRALHQGAAGYLLKDAAEAELELALRSVVAGGRYLSPGVSGEVVGALLDEPSEPETATPLTPRQQQILTLMASGLSAKQIAFNLEISAKTVETYRAQIMNRLDIRDIAGLVKYAIRTGLVTVE